MAKRAPRTVNNALALTPFYTGTRIAETIAIAIAAAAGLVTVAELLGHTCRRSP